MKYSLLNRKNLPKLNRNRIIVYLADASVIREKAILNLFYSWLSTDELARHKRFYTETLRHTFLVSRGIMRFVLGYYTNTPPGEVSYRTSQFGKPSLLHNQGIEFNLSHSGSRIALAAGRVKKLGLDLETYRGLWSPLTDLAKSCFSSDEYDQFIKLPEKSGPDDRIHRFAQLWTLKESYLKALGVGLSKPLDSFSFLFHTDGNFTLHDSELNQETSNKWNFTLFPDADIFPLSTVNKGTTAPSNMTVISTASNKYPVQSEYSHIKTKMFYIC